MKRNKFFLFFLLIYAQQGFSQERFQPAILITVARDTLNGFIDNQDWFINPDFIRYKSTLDGEVKIYNKSKLESFRFTNGDYYVSRPVSMNYYTENIKEIERSKDTILIRDTLFLRVVVRGTASLYSYSDKNHLSHFFIEKKGMKTDELVLKKHIVHDNRNNEYVETISKYRQSLSYYMNDCPKLVNKIETLVFSENDLQKLFNAYNQCVSPSDSQYEGKKDKVKLKIGVIGGLSSTLLKFTKESGFPASSLNFNNSIDFTGGILFNLVFPRYFNRYALCTEVFWKKLVTNGSVSYIEPGYYSFTPPTDTLSVFVNYSYIKVATLYNIDFLNTNIRPYIKIGIGNSFAFQSKTYSILTPYNYSKFIFRTYEQSIIASLGIKNRDCFFEVRGEIGNGIASKSYTKTLYLLLGLSF